MGPTALCGLQTTDRSGIGLLHIQKAYASSEIWFSGKFVLIIKYIFIQGGREISAIIVTDDYLCYKEPKSPYNFFSYFNI